MHFNNTEKNLGRMYGHLNLFKRLVTLPAAHSKVMVLLLLIRRLFLVPLFMGFCYGPCVDLAFFGWTIKSPRKRELVALL